MKEYIPAAILAGYLAFGGKNKTKKNPSSPLYCSYDIELDNGKTQSGSGVVTRLSYDDELDTFNVELDNGKEFTGVQGVGGHEYEGHVSGTHEPVTIVFDRLFEDSDLEDEVEEQKPIKPSKKRLVQKGGYILPSNLKKKNPTKKRNREEV